MAFVRVPGTARRYLDTDTGEEVSRREYQRRVGQPLRIPSRQERRDAKGITETLRREDRAGVRLTRAQLRRRIVEDFKSGDEDRIRRALENLGRRDPRWKFNVGETPE